MESVLLDTCLYLIIISVKKIINYSKRIYMKTKLNRNTYAIKLLILNIFKKNININAYIQIHKKCI